MIFKTFVVFRMLLELLLFLDQNEPCFFYRFMKYFLFKCYIIQRHRSINFKLNGPRYSYERFKLCLGLISWTTLEPRCFWTTL